MLRVGHGTWMGIAMAVESLHFLAQTFTFRALSSRSPGSYLSGVEDGLDVAIELLRVRLLHSEQGPGAPAAGNPLQALHTLDLLLDQLAADRPRRGRLRGTPRPPLHVEGVGRPITGALDVRANWVAALAVGLVHDHPPTSKDVADVLAEAENDLKTVQAARERLSGLGSLDEDTRTSAIRLLDDSLGRLERA